MMQKKLCCIFTFFTTTGVMQIEKKCNELGIDGKVIPVPRNITADCGLAYKSDLSNLEKIQKLCETVDFDKCYEIEY